MYQSKKVYPSNMIRYDAFGLSIHSELPFPELLPSPITNAIKGPHVTIQYGEVSREGLAESHASFHATDSRLLLCIPKVARFLVTHGQHIIIDPVAGIDQESIRVLVLGSCMGALLMQRDVFLLHGNAIKVGEHCISFVGHSGAGKSTLSGAFFKRGYSILADDVCALTTQCEVIPSFPQIKLWRDAANHLDIQTQALRKIRPGFEKYAVPLGSQFHPTSLPLKLVYVLNTHHQSHCCFTELSGMQKLPPLRDHTYRKEFLKGLKRNVERCAQIANRITVVQLHRPNDGFKLDELVDRIEDDLMKHGIT
jgi:hypothetical protein